MDRQGRIKRIRRGVAVAGVSGLAAIWGAVWGLGQGGADASPASAAAPSPGASTAPAATPSADTGSTGSDGSTATRSAGDSSATQPLTTRQS